MKKKDFIYLAVIGCLIITIITMLLTQYFGIRKKYEASFADAIEEYQEAQIAYKGAYDEIIEKQEEWARVVSKMETDLDSTAKSLNEANEKLNQIYTERERLIIEEEERYENLSDEEKEAEKVIREYNEMINTLKKDNEEYAEAYNKLSLFTSKKYSNLSSAEKKEYANCVGTKEKIEDEYIKAKEEMDYGKQKDY